jgi:hypothetical protein
MFLKNSRYHGAETLETVDRHGRPVTAVKRRRLPDTQGASYVVQGADKLDVLAERKYTDATRFWHIADANTELEANELTSSAGRVIQVPES